MAKHKFASISLTVRDRAISSKFSTHRVSKECNLCNFQKIFPSPKMAAIFEFLPKMATFPHPKSDGQRSKWTIKVNTTMNDVTRAIHITSMTVKVYRLVHIHPRLRVTFRSNPSKVKTEIPNQVTKRR